MNDNFSRYSMMGTYEEIRLERFNNLLSRIIGLEEREASRENHIAAIMRVSSRLEHEQRPTELSGENGKTALECKKPHLKGTRKKNKEDEGELEKFAAGMKAMSLKVERLESKVAQEAKEHAVLQQRFDALQQKLNKLTEESHSQCECMAAASSTTTDVVDVDAIRSQLFSILNLRVVEWSENILAQVNLMLKEFGESKGGKGIGLKRTTSFQPIRLTRFHDSRNKNDSMSANNKNINNNNNDNNNNSTNDVLQKGYPDALDIFHAKGNGKENNTFLKEKNSLVSIISEAETLPPICSNSMPTLYPNGILLKRPSKLVHHDGVGEKDSACNGFVKGACVSFSEQLDNRCLNSIVGGPLSSHLILFTEPQLPTNSNESGANLKDGCHRHSARHAPHRHSRKSSDRTLTQSTVFYPNGAEVTVNGGRIADDGGIYPPGNEAAFSSAVSRHCKRKRALPSPLDQDLLEEAYNELLGAQLRRLKAQLAKETEEDAELAKEEEEEESACEELLSANSTHSASDPPVRHSETRLPLSEAKP